MNDYKRLSLTEQGLFKAVVVVLNEAYEKYRDTNKAGVPTWPKNLRIKPVQGAARVFELTWSFSGPDGRATFEYIDMDGELGIFWRRIGKHEVFQDP